jgi:hypothetical protein
MESQKSFKDQNLHVVDTIENAILTKDNLLKRKWKGDPSCAFCQDMNWLPICFLIVL